MISHLSLCSFPIPSLCLTDHHLSSFLLKTMHWISSSMMEIGWLVIYMSGCFATEERAPSTCMNVCMCVCVYVYVCVFVYVYMYVCMCVFCMCVFARVRPIIWGTCCPVLLIPWDRNSVAWPNPTDRFWSYLAYMPHCVTKTTAKSLSSCLYFLISYGY